MLKEKRWALRAVCVSDTHSTMGQFDIPDGDLLIHAGDLTKRGYKHEIVDELMWMSKLPHKHKIFIAGNHDYYFQDRPDEARATVKDKFPGLTYLEHDLHIIKDGDRELKIYGLPHTPSHGNWAFQPKRGSEELRSHWARIPAGIDILVTHTPPMGTLDRPDPDFNLPGARVGCELLTEELKRIKPKVHVFGHVHYDFGVVNKNGTTYVNAAVRLNPRTDFRLITIIDI